MPKSPTLTGLWPPIATPFALDGAVDPDRLVALGRRLLSEGADGLVLLGTTGEANSLGMVERRALIDAVIARGIEPGRLIVGTGACSTTDAAVLTRHATEGGAAAVMLLPPFYYKPVSDDGLFAFVAEVIERAGPIAPRILLYHFPALTTAGWSIPLIARLAEAFPGVVVGLKDSSSDDAHTLRLIAAFPELAIFGGSERDLIGALRAGAAGCVTTSANVNVRALAELMANPDGPDAAARFAAVNAVRIALKPRGLFPSVKAVIARQMADDAWLALRPPLMPLSADERSSLYADPTIAALLPDWS